MPSLHIIFSIFLVNIPMSKQIINLNITICTQGEGRHLDAHGRGLLIFFIMFGKFD